MSGILDYLSNVGQPQAAIAPSPWQNRVGLFGAALKDVGAQLGGRPEDATNVATQKTGVVQNAMYQRQLGAHQALASALSSTDPAARKSALIQAASLGIDTAPYLALMNPQIEHFPMDENVSLRDPITGALTPVSSGTRKPLTSGGMQSIDNGKTWQAIPGYADQQSAIYGARYAAHAANPMPTKAKPAAAGAVSNPWKAFGGK